MPKPTTPSTKRVYSVKTYKARTDRAHARIKELEAKRKRLETSKTRIGRLNTLYTQRAALEKAGDTKKLKAFNKRYSKYLGNGQLRTSSDIRKLERKLTTRANMTATAIKTLHERLDSYTQGMKIAQKRERERGSKVKAKK